MAAPPKFVLNDRKTGRRLTAVPAGSRQTLFDALEARDIPIRTVCRGSTICGQCWVFVERGLESLPAPSPDEQDLLDRFAADDPSVRLACRLQLPDGVASIEVSTQYWVDAFPAADDT